MPNLTASQNIEELRQARELMGRSFCLDMETAMAPASFGGRDFVRLLQVGNEDHLAWWDLQTFGEEDWAYLRGWLEDPGLTVIGHNLAFDYRCLLGCGIELRGRLEDTMKASQLLWNGLTNIRHGLAPLVQRMFGVEVSKAHQTDDWMAAELSESQVAYALDDVRWTWRAHCDLQARLIDQRLMPTYRLECALIPAVVEMEHTGIPLDREHLEGLLERMGEELPQLRTAFVELLDEQLEEAGEEPLPRDGEGRINLNPTTKGSVRLGTKVVAGFNVGAPQQVLRRFNQLDIHPVDSKTGKPSLDRKLLRTFADRPVVAGYLAWKRMEKRRQMLASIQEKADWERGRVFARFDPLSTGTGRFSCVAGSTLLPTSRGVFRFDEYLPQAGDLVLTHEGRWMPVLRKVFKGHDPMVEVKTTQGGRLTCTTAHRLLTPTGWRRVGDLRPGDRLVYQSLPDREPELRAAGDPAVQSRGQTNAAAAGGCAWNDLSHGRPHPEDEPVAGGVCGRESIALLTFETRGEEPHDGQEWFPAPSIQGFSAGPERVSDRAGRQGWAGVSASADHGHGVGAGESAGCLGSASHRRGRDEQQPGQPGAGDTQGAQGAAREETEVAEVTPVGVMGVWDIEVAGDHSYATAGFLNHNSSNPNCQNIPRDTEIRNIVTAPEGRELVVVDVKNMEMGVAASEPIADERQVQAALREGVDLHLLTASLMWGITIEEVTKEQRQQAKAVNFGALYGSGAGGLKDYFSSLGQTITIEQAFRFRKAWLTAYPAFAAWHRRCDAYLQKHGCVRMVDNRRRWLPGDLARMTVVANNQTQGTAASIVKRAMVLTRAARPSTARLIAQVHDEVIVECDEGDGQEVLNLVCQSITQAGREIIGDSVLMQGEGAVARSWGEAK